MGLKEWWNRISGNESNEAKTGLSEPSEEQYDEYQSEKADTYMEQRDPGVIGMVNDEFKEDR